MAGLSASDWLYMVWRCFIAHNTTESHVLSFRNIILTLFTFSVKVWLFYHHISPTYLILKVAKEFLEIGWSNIQHYLSIYKLNKTLGHQLQFGGIKGIFYRKFTETVIFILQKVTADYWTAEQSTDLIMQSMNACVYVLITSPVKKKKCVAHPSHL